MNNTLHNGFRVLEYLADKAEALSIKEIAEHFQLPNSHICRLLKSLTEIGYAEQLPGSRKYRISLKILNLAHARLKKERLLRLARPYLRQLSDKLDAAVYVTRVYCGYSLIIGTEYPPLFNEQSNSIVGTLHSPTSSACGRVCAAFSSDETRETLLEAIDWSAPGDFLGRREAFAEELALVRKRGYAIRDLSGSTGALGVPLFEENGVFNGALGVLLPSRTSRDAGFLESAVESTVACGRLISYAQGASLEEYPHYNTSARRKK